jgi:hypothetical protein
VILGGALVAGWVWTQRLAAVDLQRRIEKQQQQQLQRLMDGAALSSPLSPGTEAMMTYRMTAPTPQGSPASPTGGTRPRRSVSFHQTVTGGAIGAQKEL